MPPFLIAGVVYTLTRVASTFGAWVWDRTGVTELFEFARNHPDAAKRRDFRAILGSMDIARRLAYDLTTNEGRLEMAADLAAVGFKFGALKLGIPLIQRLVGAAGTGFVVRALPDLVTMVTDLSGFLQEGPSFLKTLTDSWNEAVRTIEEGKKLAGEAGDVLAAGTEVGLETLDFVGKATAFAAAPSVLSAPGLIIDAVELAESIIGFIASVIAFLPETTEEEREELRFLREELPEDPGRFVPKPSRPKRPRPKSVGPILLEVLDTYEADLEARPPGPTPPGGIVPILGDLVVGPEGKLEDLLRARLSTSAVGAPLRRFSRIGVSDLRRIVEEAKKG